jgi:acyl-CoA carboxylase epsilon subunit
MHNESPSAGPAAQAGVTDAPLLTVVRGQPTDAEMAAVVAVLAARAAAARAIAARAAVADQQAPARTARSAWSDRSRQLRQPLIAGPGAWRASALPR